MDFFDHLNSWDERGKGLLLDLAAYSIISENNAAQHYPEYAYNHPSLTSGHKIYSDSTISRFLSEIGSDERMDFLNSWNDCRNHKERIYVSYDSTNKNCKAGDIEKAEYGHPKEDVGAPIFNYSIEYSCAATPQIRQTGNRLSGLAETAYASLLAQCFV